MLEFASNNRDYDEQIELHRYVWRNYRRGLTKREHALHHAAIIEIKAQRSPYLRDNDPNYFYDADVAAIVESGLVAFERQCCERLLRDCADQIYINRCDHCHRIVVSPVACLCLWCGHSWYERRAEMVARSNSSIYFSDLH